MAITKVSPDLLDLDAGITISVADNSDNLTLTSTDADANSGPNLRMYRNSSSPADSDAIGLIDFEGRNDNSQDVVYAAIDTRIVDASDGSEDGRIEIATILGGTAGVSRILMDSTETVFNDNSASLDFRVEADGNANMLFVDASADRVGIGTASPADLLHLVTSSGNSRIRASNGTVTSFSGIDSANTMLIGTSSNHDVRFMTNDSERMRIDSSGNVGIGMTPTHQLSVVGTGAATAINIGSVDASFPATLGMFVSSTAHTQTAYGDLNIKARTDYGGYYGIGFFTASSDNTPALRVKIDSSGNLMVGKTVVNSATVGFEARADGRMFATASGSYSGYFNRGSNDGSHLIFAKDDGMVGSIGTEGGDLVIGTGDTAFQFCDSLNSIRPWNVSTNGGQDGTIDMGTSNLRYDDIYATNGTIQTSDRDEKNTIVDSDLGLDFVKRLSPKSYKFNNKTRTHYGLVAQDVETVLSDISKSTTDFAGFIKDDISEKQDDSKHRYGLRYTEFVSPLIKAIQEQQEQIEQLKTEIQTLKGE